MRYSKLTYDIHNTYKTKYVKKFITSFIKKKIIIFWFKLTYMYYIF